jgi:hypothetical protein
MNAPRYKSKAFRLFRDGEMIVIADRDEEGVGGVIANIIIWDLVAIPFCLLFFIVGVWMLAHLPTEKDPIQNINPAFYRFMSPAVAYAFVYALVVLMALFFTGFSAFMIYTLVRAQPRMLPSESRFKQDEKGEWMFQRKVWFVSLPWKRLGPDWTIWCSPTYSRGDWGHMLQMRILKRKLWLAWSGGWTASESDARAEGLKDLESLVELFQVPGEVRRIRPWRFSSELAKRILPSQTFREAPQAMAAFGRRPQPRRFHFVWSKARFRQELKTLPVGLPFIGVIVAMYVVPSLAAGTIAAILFLLAIASVIYDSRLGRGGCRTQGIVVGHRPAVGGGGVFPLIEFRDRDGNIRREETRLGGSLERPPVGSRVTVVYDPKGKRGCEIDRFWRRFGFEMVLFLFGAAFAYVAIFG